MRVLAASLGLFRRQKRQAKATRERNEKAANTTAVNPQYRGGSDTCSRAGGVSRVEITEEEGIPAAPTAKPGNGAVDSASNERWQPPSSRVRRAEENRHSRERGTNEQQIGLRVAADASVLAVRDGENGIRGETATGGDQISREVGVETLDTPSSLSTDESPDWVRFSDSITNGSGPTEGVGAAEGSGASWTWDVDNGSSVPDGGFMEAGRRSWGSGGRSWSKHPELEY